MEWLETVDKDKVIDLAVSERQAVQKTESGNTDRHAKKKDTKTQK